MNLDLESIAKFVHDECWTPFAKGIMSSEKLSKERIDRWNNECFMPYSDLSEEMKEKDRDVARKLINHIKTV